MIIFLPLQNYFIFGRRLFLNNHKYFPYIHKHSIIMTLGEKIKTIRTIKGYSQEYVAEKIGISSSTFSKIERNEISANWDRINEIAEILDISISELVSFGEKNVFNMTGDGLMGNVNNGLMGNVVIGNSKEILTLSQRIEKIEKEIEYIKQKFENK